MCCKLCFNMYNQSYNSNTSINVPLALSGRVATVLIAFDEAGRIYLQPML